MVVAINLGVLVLNELMGTLENGNAMLNSRLQHYNWFKVFHFSYYVI